MTDEKRKELLTKVKTHNANLKAGTTGTMSRTEVRELYEKDMEVLSKDIAKTRVGYESDTKGRMIAPYDVSLEEALQFRYGIGVAQYLKGLGIAGGTDTLSSLARSLGGDSLSVNTVESLMINHFDGVNTAEGQNPEFRFLIPELILNAIRTDYMADSYHQNWIGTTVNISQDEVTMPHIKRGNATPRRIGEAESIPFGTVAFGQKKATVFKTGVGFKITDELIYRSSIDLLFQFLGEVGTDMAIGADAEALYVLINGEQADSSESAPVIGVASTGAGFAWDDIKRVTSRMARLKRPANRIITNESEGIAISGIDKFQGFDGVRTLATLRSILGVPDTLDHDVFSMPADQAMFLSAARCMAKLNYRGMRVERRRNPQTQVEETFVSNFVGFSILRRDARVILDRSIAFSGNGFPAYMDIDSRINQAFRTIQG